MVPSRPKTAAEARGDSCDYRLGLLRRPVLSSGGREARPVGPWTRGRRRGVPCYVSVAELAPGGVSGRLGANPTAEDGPVNDDTEVT